MCILLLLFRPHKTIIEFWVTDLNILGRVCKHICFNYFYSGKIFNFMHFEKHFAFKMHKIIFFFRKPEKIYVSPVKGRVGLPTIWAYCHSSINKTTPGVGFKILKLGKGFIAALSNVVARTLKILRTSKGEYWTLVLFNCVPFHIGNFF